MSHQRISPEQLSLPRRNHGIGVITPALFAATWILAAPAGAASADGQRHQAGNQSTTIETQVRPGRSANISYAAPAYLVGSIRAPVIYFAPYEPYVDGGSVVGAPPRGIGFGW